MKDEQENTSGENETLHVRARTNAEEKHVSKNKSTNFKMGWDRTLLIFMDQKWRE